jgi:predicted Fe-Mo cluster-binding NifX family protein
MKKIALASEDNNGLDGRLSAHFGRCPYYVVADVDDDDVKGFEVVGNPHFDNHQPGVMPEFISSLGANVIIAGGMGPRAINIFNDIGIEVVTGFVGKIGDILDAYMKGKIEGSAPCEHDHGGECH